MLTRSLILLGLCAALGLGQPAFAAPAKPQSASVVKSADAKAAVKSQKKVASKKGQKTLAAKEAPKQLTDKEKARARELAKEKQREAQKLAMRAKAKQLAEEKAKARKAPVEVAELPKGKKAAKPEKAVTFETVALTSAKPKPALTAERIAAQQAAAVGAAVVVAKGNNGELRSEVSTASRGGFFEILFGDEASTSNLLPETRALDTVLEQKQAKKQFKVKPEYMPQSVDFSGYPRGTIVIDTDAHFLYLVESGSSARRYGIAVGRDGLQFKGEVKVGDKQEWPRWIPTLDMQKREPKKYGQYKDGMPGGGQNPLGARAIYLYQGKQDTHLRIHGTIAPQTIGTNSSNGCFRMINEHVIDLYGRVRQGTPVVIL